jgi:hypothetical protein
MKTPISSFIIHISSFALLLALGGKANAQWIIDGRQVQTLNLNVSDPQALYADGSRELTGTIPLASSLAATGGIFRAYIPWDSQDAQFFVMNEDAEAFEFSDSGNVGPKLGALRVSENSLYHSDENVKIDWSSHMLEGGWQIDQVLPYDEALINRGYADTRYLRAEEPLTAPLSFNSASTATSGLFRAYNEWNGAYEDLLVYDADNELIKLGDLTTAFKIGGLRIRQHDITDLDAGNIYISFEEGLLGGGNWAVSCDPVDNGGIVSRGYADSRYVMNGQDSVALGLDTVATGDYSIATGYKNLASGKYSVAFNGAVDPEEPEEGVFTNVASGMGSAVFGWGNIASGNGAVAFGWESVAGGDWSFAAGSSDAIGEFSTAFGEICNASGSDSFAVGYNTSASGIRAVALGHSTSASAQGAFANGFLSSATENYSTAWGRYCEASGLNAIALGNRAKALHPGAVVIADNQDADATSATNNTFTVRAQNGVYLQTDTIHSSGSLAFDASVGTSTSGLFKVVTSWNGPADMFLFDSDEEAFVLSSIGAGLRIGSLQISSGGLFHVSEGTAVDFGEHILTGGWQVDEVLPYSEAIISRGYADDRYLMRTEGVTSNHTVQAGDVLVISNGLITAINP